MNLSTFYYLAILISIAAKLFGYLQTSWAILVLLALAPIGLIILLAFVAIFAAAISGNANSNKPYDRFRR